MFFKREFKNISVITREDCFTDQGRFVLVLENLTSEAEAWKILVGRKNLSFIVFNKENDRYSLLMKDASNFTLSHDELESFCVNFDNLHWFRSRLITVEESVFEMDDYEKQILDLFPRSYKEPYFFGTFALRRENGFLTTPRGKMGEKVSPVYVETNIEDNEVKVSSKATLNAPLLAKLLIDNPDVNVLLHGHEVMGEELELGYTFPGTVEELSCSKYYGGDFLIKLDHHGFIAGFNDNRSAIDWMINYYNEKLDWNRYSQSFPERYVKASKFDNFLLDNLKNLPTLEIGGGKGSKFSRDFNGDLFLLDPYVDLDDSIYVERDEFESSKSYEQIVSRGSFNYLTEKQILCVMKKIKSKGRWIFNSFQEAPKEIIKRDFIAEDNHGKEISEYLKPDLIKHSLLFKDTSLIHYFFYRDLDSLEKLAKLSGCSIKVLDIHKNSIVYEIFKD